MNCRHMLSALVIAACLAGPAFGQINPFRNTRATPLNSEDIAALTDATNRLLDNPQVKSGNSESWDNPRSGASGTATAGNATHRKGLACRVVNYQLNVPGARPQRGATLTWCKTKDGWKIG